MIAKRITPSAWFRDYPSTNLLEVHSRGPERSQLQKIAAANFLGASEIRPEKGHSFIHLITTGSQECYGPNNNADGFNEKAASFEVPEHHRTGRSQKLMLGAGLTGYHSTFMKYGAVYREHKNSKKGGVPQGDIISEGYNSDMHRGELIIRVQDSKWGPDLQKLAKGDPVFWSMGCGVPYDICTICANQAPTVEDHCDHVKYNKLGITKEGNQVFVINDQPHFHDISRVMVPADRIAFALQKVANGGTSYPEEVDATQLWLPLGITDKIGSSREAENMRILQKLAELEKRIIVRGMDSDDANISDALGANLDNDTLKELMQFPLDSVLGSLKKERILLPPEDFMRIVMKRPEGDIAGLDGLPHCIGDMFSRLEQAGDSEVATDSSYSPMCCPHRSGLVDTVERLQPSHSINDEPVRLRIIQIAIKGRQGQSKQATHVVKPIITDETEILAREYAKYQVSFLSGDPGYDKYAHRIIVHNQTAR